MIKRAFVVLILLIVSAPVFADVIPNLAQMLANLTATKDQLMRLVTAFGYVAGMFFIIKGVIELKHFGESRTMMSEEHGLKGPLFYLFVGAALLYLPTSVQVAESTLWQTTSPLAYSNSSSNPWSSTITDAFTILELIGTIAFIRGLIILAGVGGKHGQPGKFNQAMAHIVGGVLCINMYQFVQTVNATLGLGNP